MKTIALLMMVVLLGSSCKGESEKSLTNGDGEHNLKTSEDTTSFLSVGCYVYRSSGNSIFFEITEVGKKIKGILVYDLAEKDRNNGTFEGKLDDAILIGNYHFKSEGLEGKREVAFMVKDDMLIEGYGELNGNGTSFKNYDSIRYASTMPLRKSECMEGRTLSD